MKNVKECIDSYIANGYVKNIAVRAGIGDEIFCDIYNYDKSPINSKTMFDMASVTKIMATTSLALIAMDKNLLSIKDNVSKFFAVPDDKKDLTVYNLLTHTIGIGHKPLNINGNNYHNIQDYILSIPLDAKVGSQVLYSCPGFILLGKILEKVFDSRLDELFNEYVAKPLKLENTCFLPYKNNNFVNSNLSEEEKGVVNDYNCRFLGGIAGNAGIFSNVDDICKYLRMLQNHGEPIICKETFKNAVKNYTPEMSESRALGFLYVDEKYSQTGCLFPKSSIGHCGHTGQSIFVDTKSGLYAVILSDATISTVKKYGYERYDIVQKMREDIHNALYKDLLENNKCAKHL